jgi:hypothetical protein
MVSRLIRWLFGFEHVRSSPVRFLAVDSPSRGSLGVAESKVHLRLQIAHERNLSSEGAFA